VILVPVKKSSKKHAKAGRVFRGKTFALKRKRSDATKALEPQRNATYSSKHHSAPVKKSVPKVLKPDINVRRSAYSKVARLVVLGSAAARQKLIEAGGENTIDLIREFDRDMSDEELARKTGVRTSDVRVVLNRLHSCGLFTYTRVRDRESGWYSYIWKMSEDRLRQFADDSGPGIANECSEDSGGDGDYLQKNLVMQETQVSEAGNRKRR